MIETKEITEPFVVLYGRIGCFMIESFLYEDSDGKLFLDQDGGNGEVCLTFTPKTFFNLIMNKEILSEWTQCFGDPCTPKILAAPSEILFLLKLMKIL